MYSAGECRGVARTRRPLVLEILMVVFVLLGGANAWGALLEFERDGEYLSVMVSCAAASACFAFYFWFQRRKYRAIQAKDSGTPIRAESEIFAALMRQPWMAKRRIMGALVWVLIAGGMVAMGYLSVMMAELAEYGGIFPSGWSLKVASMLALILSGVALPLRCAYSLDLRFHQKVGGEAETTPLNVSEWSAARSSVGGKVARWIFWMLAVVSLVVGSIVSVFAFYGIAGWVGGVEVHPIENARTQLAYYAFTSGVASFICLLSAFWFSRKARYLGYSKPRRGESEEGRVISGFHIWTACALILASMIYSVPRLLAARDARPLHGYFDVGLRCMGGHEVFFYLDGDSFYEHCPGHRDTRLTGRAMRSASSVTEISKIGRMQRIRVGWRMDYDAKHDRHVLWLRGEPHVVYQVNNPWRTWFPKFMPE